MHGTHMPSLSAQKGVSYPSPVWGNFVAVLGTTPPLAFSLSRSFSVVLHLVTNLKFVRHMATVPPFVFYVVGEGAMRSACFHHYASNESCRKIVNDIRYWGILKTGNDELIHGE